MLALVLLATATAAAAPASTPREPARGGACRDVAPRVNSTGACAAFCAVRGCENATFSDANSTAACACAAGGVTSWWCNGTAPPHCTTVNATSTQRCARWCGRRVSGKHASSKFEHSAGRSTCRCKDGRECASAAPGDHTMIIGEYVIGAFFGAVLVFGAFTFLRHKCGEADMRKLSGSQRESLTRTGSMLDSASGGIQ